MTLRHSDLSIPECDLICKYSLNLQKNGISLPFNNKKIQHLVN